MYYFCGIPKPSNLRHSQPLLPQSLIASVESPKKWKSWDWNLPPAAPPQTYTEFTCSSCIQYPFLTIELPVNCKDDGFVEAQKKNHNKHNGNITPNHCFQHAPSLKTKVKWSSSQVGLNLKNKTHVGKWNHQLHNIHPNVWSSIVSANLWPKRFGVRRHSSRTSDPNTPIAAGPTGVWLLQCDLHQWHSPKE